MKTFISALTRAAKAAAKPSKRLLGLCISVGLVLLLVAIGGSVGRAPEPPQPAAALATVMPTETAPPPTPSLSIQNADADGIRSSYNAGDGEISSNAAIDPSILGHAQTNTIEATGINAPTDNNTTPFTPPAPIVSNFHDDVGLHAGVPEPSLWAMMLVGFGALGGALRARRSHAEHKGEATEA